ncbi:MAG: hypothetical protein QOJ54_1817 [Aliidongia sp.]|jgi:hypothetical protein|nr:hypothetical protein [Aliidongia sp.]
MGVFGNFGDSLPFFYPWTGPSGLPRASLSFGAAVRLGLLPHTAVIVFTTAFALYAGAQGIFG